MSGIRLIASLVSMLLTGCSFLMVTAPGKHPVSETPHCSTGRGAIVADGLFAAAYGVATLALISNDAGGAVGIPLAAGGLHVASMLSGNGRVQRCRAAFAAHEAWESQARKQMEAGAIAPSSSAQGAGVPPAPVPATGAPPASAPVASAPPASAPVASAPPAVAPPAVPPRRPPPATAAPAPARPDTTSNPPTESSRAVPDEPSDESSDEPWADFWVRPQ